ncbi:MAG TPA: PASTA domain-containing protein, partial [Acidimicrobiales bacterium]|nr:PASTA domain-containing protein [Acidimicrobiales bacterium]
ADVYSLALVTFESLTGYVPFVLDTAMGTLAARIGATLPGHGALGPLQPILSQAASPDRRSRPDAAGFAARLEALGATLPRPQALPLASPILLSEGPPTMAGAPADATAAVERTAVLNQTARVAAGPGQVFDLDAFETGDERSRTVDLGRSRRRKWLIVLCVLVVLALIAAGLVAALQKGVFTPSHPVPPITGLTVAEARQSLAKDHFTLSALTPVASVTVKAGRIVLQDPSAGGSLKQGSAVNVTVSKGLPIESVPSLGGLGCAGATRLLAVNHLKGLCPATAAVYSDSVPIGQVINWSYNNKLDATHAPYGAAVLIALSKGPQPKVIPNVAGDTYPQAQAALQALGLTVDESTSPSTNYPLGQVDHTNPPSGSQVQPGSTVIVYVSSGPPTVQVPNLSGDTVAQAEAALQSHGLQVGFVYGPTHGNVWATAPEPGMTEPEGSSVTLYTR